MAALEPPVFARHGIATDHVVGVLRDYVRAKDEHRPHLMQEVFHHDAVVETTASTTARRSLPPRVEGLEAITKALVSDFASAYENAYTFYLGSPAGRMQGMGFECDWLAVMTARADGKVRVACGQYGWRFGARPFTTRALATHLRIEIVAATERPPEDWGAVQAWIAQLSYPWSRTSAVLGHWPQHFNLPSVRSYLGRARPRPTL